MIIHQIIKLFATDKQTSDEVMVAKLMADYDFSEITAKSLVSHRSDLHTDTMIQVGNKDNDLKLYYITQPSLSGEWCECGSMEDPYDVTFYDDGTCTCGIKKHHYHHNKCGKVYQIG